MGRGRERKIIPHLADECYESEIFLKVIFSFEI